MKVMLPLKNQKKLQTVATFNLPSSQDDYDNHPTSTTPSCDLISDIHVSSEGVKRILLSLDVNKVTGPDKIPARLLRCYALYTSSSLSDLFNKSLKVGTITTEWKTLNITPIPKGYRKNETSNYRAIRLLSIVSKVLERCIYD